MEMAQRVNIEYVKFYTQGSAAKRISPAIPVRTGALPVIKKRKLRRVYVDPVAMLGIVVAVCMLAMMAVGVSNLQKEQSKTAQMAEYVQYLQQENEALQEQYTAECDLEKIEQTALALGMIPQENAVHMSIEVELPQTQDADQITIWQRIGTFLTGLFA